MGAPQNRRMKSDSFNLTRRQFIKSTSVAVAGAALGTTLLTSNARAFSPRKMIGIQAGAVSFVDEGTEKVLDIIQEKGAVNTSFLATFTYGRVMGGRQVAGRPLPDHGKQE